MLKNRKIKFTNKQNPVFCDILNYPVITEKSTQLVGAEGTKHKFAVAKWANKMLIKEAVENLFGAKVAKVNIINSLGKYKRIRGKIAKMPDKKYAIITLAKGDVDFPNRVV